jgi:uncharacterized phage protein (TIGR01671 family)
MNREIKFRVWDIELQIWVNNIGMKKDNILTNGTEKRFCVMQYTGLTDKNGKEIYENDILQWTSSNPFSLGEIRKVKINYVQAQYWGQGRGLGIYLAELLANEKCEVIGNIFENPELLKE